MMNDFSASFLQLFDSIYSADGGEEFLDFTGISGNEDECNLSRLTINY